MVTFFSLCIIDNHRFLSTPKSCLQLGGVHKLCLQEKGGSWSKKSTFCKLLYHRKCKWRGVGGQKKSNLINVVCKRPLTLISMYLVDPFGIKGHEITQLFFISLLTRKKAKFLTSLVSYLPLSAL